jgi:small-conductance mechanosensitive channel
VRSAVNRNIWRLFAAEGIAIPMTQREVRIVGGSDIVSQAIVAAGQVDGARGNAA